MQWEHKVFKWGPVTFARIDAVEDSKEGEEVIFRKLEMYQILYAPTSSLFVIVIDIEHGRLLNYVAKLKEIGFKIEIISSIEEFKAFFYAKHKDLDPLFAAGVEMGLREFDL
jgi:hypothetical protein